MLASSLTINDNPAIQSSTSSVLSGDVMADDDYVHVPSETDTRESNDNR